MQVKCEVKKDGKIIRLSCVKAELLGDGEVKFSVEPPQSLKTIFGSKFNLKNIIFSFINFCNFLVQQEEEEEVDEGGGSQIVPPNAPQGLGIQDLIANEAFMAQVRDIVKQEIANERAGPAEREDRATSSASVAPPRSERPHRAASAVIRRQ